MSNLHHFHKTCSQHRAISSLAYPIQMHCHLKDSSWVKKQRLQTLLCKICNLDKNVSNNYSSSKWSKKNWWSFRIRWRAINPKFHKGSSKQIMNQLAFSKKVRFRQRRLFKIMRYQIRKMKSIWRRLKTFRSWQTMWWSWRTKTNLVPGK